MVMVETNIGSMPLEDYRDIKARQFGFDDYDDMYCQGFRLGNGYDYESIEDCDDDYDYDHIGLDGEYFD